MIKRITLYTLLIILILLIGSGCFLTLTTPGLKCGFTILNKFTPGKLTAENIHGSFFSEITITDLSYQNNKNKANFQKIQITLKPMKLLSGKLHIKNLSIENAKIETIKSDKSATITLPQLNFKPLIKLRADNVNITNLVILHNHELALRLNNLHLQAYTNNSVLHIKKFAFSGYPYSGTLAGSVQLSDKYKTDLHGEITTNFNDYKPIHANLDIIGDLEKLMSLRFVISQPYPTIIKATLKEFLTKGQINATGKWQNLIIPISENKNITSSYGIIAINGTMHDYAFHINTDFYGTNIPKTHIKINGFGNENNIRSKNISIITANGFISGSANLTWHPAKTWQIQLHVQNVIPNVSFDFNSTGNSTHSTILGNVKIANGQAKIEELNTSLKHINISATINKNQAIEFNGSTMINNNTLDFHGHSTLYNMLSSTKLTLTGQNIQLINTDEYNIIASPNIEITYKKPDIIISGDILIPSATLNPQDFSTTTTLPDYVTITDRKKPAKTNKIFYSNLKINLGQNVFIKSTTLNSRLTGQLTINSSLNNPITAFGELNLLQGKFTAYGQKLTITKGNLLFTGASITSPTLNIHAIKRIKTPAKSISTGISDQAFFASSLQDLQSITVGIRATGKLKTPTLKLFSQPPGLSDTDILSYLLLGVPATNATNDQTQALFRTAQLMGLSGGKITGELQNKFGLTEFGISKQEAVDSTNNGTTTQPAFAIGKYLNPRLYLHYSIGMINPVSIVNLSYQLTKRIILQSQTSAIDNGADFLYSFETN